MIKNILIVIMAIVIVILGSFMFLRGLDRVKSPEFPTLRDARAAGLGDRGWIPTSFPDCLKDVKIVTNVDTNEAFYKFTLPQDCR